MTLAEYLAALAAHINALYGLIEAMSNPGMTDAEALAMGALSAQVATIAERVDGAVAALATLTGVVTGHAEKMAALQSSLDAQAQRVDASEAGLQALQSSIGTLPALPALPSAAGA